MVWSAHSIPLNTLPFLSFHKVHKKHKGATFTLFLPTKMLFHPSKFPFTVECITHCTSKMEKIIFHTTY